MSDSKVAGLVTNVDLGYRNWNPYGASTLTECVAIDDETAWAKVLLNSTNTLSNWLNCKNYGFTIPINATIDGIEVYVHRFSITNPFYDVAIRVFKGSDASNNKAVSSSWKQVQTVTYGGSTDLWGLTWTPDDINSDTFKFRVRNQYTGTDPVNIEAGVDYHSMTIYWHIDNIFGVSVQSFNGILPTMSAIIDVLYGVPYLTFGSSMPVYILSLGSTILVSCDIIGLLNMIPLITAQGGEFHGRPNRYIEYFTIKCGKKGLKFRVPKSPYKLED